MKRIADDEREDEMDENLDQVCSIPYFSFPEYRMILGWQSS